MTSAPDEPVTFDDAREIADAVLYEGYLLYPYRASAAKNQVRWQFGVLAPPVFASEEAGEFATARTECVMDARPGATVRIRLRFLHVQQRRVEDESGRSVDSVTVEGREIRPWTEAVEVEHDVTVPLDEAAGSERGFDVEIPGVVDVEPVQDVTATTVGRIVRDRQPVSACLVVGAEPLRNPFGGYRLRVEIRNTTSWREPDPNRDEALRRSLVAAHLVLGVGPGRFVSSTDPPEWAKPFVDECVNERTWPVLIGSDERSEVMLSAPIILYDDPAIAPESAQPLFDGTEIDEILTLRTLALTDEEKREARMTDDRARELLDAVEDMPGAVLERLHGTMRYFRDATASRPDSGATDEGAPIAAPGMEPDVPRPTAPWWDPGVDASVDPDTDSVHIAGEDVAKGSSVTLTPGIRTTDAQDMFLWGRKATVQAVFLDVDDETYLAVTLDDDPVSDMQGRHGRFLYFRPDEVRPVNETGSAAYDTSDPAGTTGAAP
ncbi:hypothetical protein GIY23_09515 [Allosaccharopolyspora coralli]|uniref:Uncharacterized protein n=1 Tax=Allosaccharopolyspora coralli TaxID=2665642 RepID=A0A5Q3Q5H8_9PSEU|nr:hypothetical protein [Allosaccharopolyspora coralli]QGK69722.1 hypothetical protein GIY23_09515 [Allosaccharopolyspora coralli]